MSETITPSTVVKARPDVVSSDLADGAALLDLRSSMYFSLNAVGAQVWKSMQEPTAVSALCAGVAEAFDVSPEACAQDVITLVRQLRENDLVELADAPAG